MKLTKYFLLLISVAIVVMSSIAAYPSARSVYKSHRLKVLYQVAVASKFPGYTQIQTEKLSCAPDTAGNAAIFNMSVHTVLPDGSDSDVTYELASGKTYRHLWMPTAKPPQQISAQDHINAKTSMKLSTNSPVQAMLLMADPSRDCLFSFEGYPTLPGSTTKTGNETLYIRNSAGDLIGYPAVKVQSAPSDRQMTVWFLPTAGCVRAKTYWEFFPVPGKPLSKGSTSVIETTQLDVGPPVNSVQAFSIPPSDVEMSPTEVTRASIKWGIWQRTDLDEAAKQALWAAKQDFQPTGAGEGFQKAYEANKVQ